MKGLLVVLVVAVVLLFLAAGLGFLPLPGSQAQATAPVLTDRVEMPLSYRFDPPVIQVKAGTTVTWHNGDNFTHSVKVGDGPDHLVPPGESVSIAFDKPGEYAYVCSLHSNDMHGKVIVTP